MRTLRTERRVASPARRQKVSRLSAAGGGGATGTVWIEIADHGPGFEPGALEDAFEPLAPGTNARNERGSGLGLGLFIARRLVETHRGRLTARSAPGEGSVFRIELPV